MSTTDFRCRSCESTRHTELLELGDLPLANAFVTPGGDEDRLRAPLTLVMCPDCRLIQLRELVDRERLFRHYLWVTGTSEAAAAHAPRLAASLAARHRRSEGDLLVEIASNDGFFLRHFRDAGFRVLGVDPADVAREATAAGLPTIQSFFGMDVAREVLEREGAARVIVARNVIGHASGLRDLIAGAAQLLAPDGRMVIEHPYAYFLRSELQYDTVFHEHVSYFTVKTVADLVARFGLALESLDFVPMNGGSMLATVAHRADCVAGGGAEMIAFEELIRLNEADGWADFRRQVEHQRRSLSELLEGLAAEGRRVVGYGAAAKCMTMLNYCGVTPDLLHAIGDANPRKQGLLCPGVRIPVVSPQELLETDPDYILIGPANLREEIVRQLHDNLGYRGRFIFALPQPEVVG